MAFLGMYSKIGSLPNAKSSRETSKTCISQGNLVEIKRQGAYVGIRNRVLGIPIRALVERGNPDKFGAAPGSIAHEKHADVRTFTMVYECERRPTFTRHRILKTSEGGCKRILHEAISDKTPKRKSLPAAVDSIPSSHHDSTIPGSKASRLHDVISGTSIRDSEISIGKVWLWHWSMQGTNSSRRCAPIPTQGEHRRRADGALHQLERRFFMITQLSVGYFGGYRDHGGVEGCKVSVRDNLDSRAHEANRFLSNGSHRFVSKPSVRLIMCIS
ncbi:hypothetical protein BS50DRAFT_652891 [Corynespora cassiicola Philippines]|uniref:Uncharacterized protein n=1 Tax=Corynespora cassiicola Philippines TaxID=1448308 RepID=A0A2T2P509_CORCC|nr:hypothetical protein BS50DRAFT_652891 [Corynespora cassiicola Philippines]